MAPNQQDLLLRISGDSKDAVASLMELVGSLKQLNEETKSEAPEEAKTAWDKYWDAITLGVTKGELAADVIKKLNDMVGAAILALPRMVNTAANLGDHLKTLGQQTGVSVERLSQFRFVANQTGTSVETLARTVFDLGRRTQQGGDAIEQAFRTIGVSIESVKKMKPEEGFVAVMEALHQMPNAAERAAAGVAIFGPKFRQISQLAQEDIRGLLAEAERLGLTISTETADQSDKFKDAIGRLDMMIEAAKNRIGFAFLPALTAVAEAAPVAGGTLMLLGKSAFDATVNFGKLAAGAGPAVGLLRDLPSLVVDIAGKFGGMARSSWELAAAVAGVGADGTKTLQILKNIGLWLIGPGALFGATLVGIAATAALIAKGFKDAYDYLQLIGKNPLPQWVVNLTGLTNERDELEKVIREAQSKGGILGVPEMEQQPGAPPMATRITMHDGFDYGAALQEREVAMQETMDSLRRRHARAVAFLKEASGETAAAVAENQRSTMERLRALSTQYREELARLTDEENEEIRRLLMEVGRSPADIADAINNGAKEGEEGYKVSAAAIGFVKEQLDKAKASAKELADAAKEAEEAAAKVFEKIQEFERTGVSTADQMMFFADAIRGVGTTAEAISPALLTLEAQIERLQRAGLHGAAALLKAGAQTVQMIGSNYQSTLPEYGAMPGADEAQFRAWYQDMSSLFGLSPNWEGQHYDYRGAFRAGAAPDASGHWPSQFKLRGHPSSIVGGFDAVTGERVPGTERFDLGQLINAGWDEETAQRLAQMPEPSAGGKGGTAYQTMGIAPIMPMAEGMSEQFAAVFEEMRKTIGEKFRESMQGLFADIPNILIQSFTGGGGLGGAMNAIGTRFGTALFSDGGPFEGFTKTLSNGAAKWVGKILPDSIAGVVGDVVGGLVPLVGPLLGKAAEWITGLFGKSEGEKVNDARDLLLEDQGGFDALAEKVHAATGNLEAFQALLDADTEEEYAKALEGIDAALQQLARKFQQLEAEANQTNGKLTQLRRLTPELKKSLEGLYNAKTPDEYAAAMKAVNAEADKAIAKQKEVDSALGRLGMTWDQLGAPERAVRLGEMFDEIYKDILAVEGAGADLNFTILQAGPSLSELVQKAKETGTEIPAHLRPIIEQLIALGGLVDENGNKITDLTGYGVKFGDTYTSEAAAVETAMDRVVEVLEAIARALGAIPEEVNTEVNVNENYHADPRRPGMEEGGYDPSAPPDPGSIDYASQGGYVTSDGLQYFGGGGRVRDMSKFFKGADVFPAMLSLGEAVFTPRHQDIIAMALKALEDVNRLQMMQTASAYNFDLGDSMGRIAASLERATSASMNTPLAGSSDTTNVTFYVYALDGPSVDAWFERTGVPTMVRVLKRGGKNLSDVKTVVMK